MDPEDPEPIHGWFQLSYSHYLVLPRSALQSMPVEWQRRLVACLEEMHSALGDLEPHGSNGYWGRAKDANGKMVHDPLREYERGRRRLPMKVGAN